MSLITHRGTEQPITDKMIDSPSRIFFKLLDVTLMGNRLINLKNEIAWLRKPLTN